MTSSIPLMSDFVHTDFAAFLSEIGHPFQVHRKLWEFAYIIHQLNACGMLAPGNRGLCFGAGDEPLPAVFAKRGCIVTATDAPTELIDGSWIATGQHAASIQKLARPHIVGTDTFLQRVTFEPCDMNSISDHLKGYDFCWSACCLEHLGSLRHGIDFIINSVEKTLKVGGIACHTSELNLTSNSETFETPQLSLYRRKDIEGAIEELRNRGHEVSPLVLSTGASAVDYHVDLPPYSHNPSLKIQLDRFVTTSVGLVIRRGR
jgi:hypothetical protein